MKDEALLIKQVIARSSPKENPDTSLPEVVNLSLEAFMEAYPDWLRWRALDRRYPPNVIRQQPRWLIDAFIQMDMILDRITAQFYEQRNTSDG